MKRLQLIIGILFCVLTTVNAQYYSVNYDKQTVAAMAGAYNAEAVTEAYYNQQVQSILKHYSAAEVASAGIYASKFLERKALTNLGIWTSSTENYFYRRIYHMFGETMSKIENNEEIGSEELFSLVIGMTNTMVEVLDENESTMRKYFEENHKLKAQVDRMYAKNKKITACMMDSTPLCTLPPASKVRHTGLP